MTVLRQTLNEIYAPVESELQEFSQVLKKELASQDELIGGIHEHLLKMSGKYLRPALALLASRLNDAPSKPEAAKLAATIELIHTATLVHDDIIDDSALRRNQPTIYSKWGREISIVSGDYLYAKAFLLLADLKDVWMTQALAACAHVMCEGEMKQIEKRSHFLMTENEYLKIIHQKTAALFQASCAGGAYLSGMDRAGIERLSNYGFGLGMAFQIVDDCLDLVSETENLGKTAGLDVYKNDVTLPLLYLFRDLEGSQRNALLEAIQKERADLLDQIKTLVAEKKSVEKAMEKARGYIDKALAELEPVRPSIYKESLVNLAHYCLERIR